jgi:hypothetical protein
VIDPAEPAAKGLKKPDEAKEVRAKKEKANLTTVSVLQIDCLNSEILLKIANASSL